MGAGRRVLVLLVITFIYLFIGAVVFSTIESAHEEKIKLDLHNHFQTFVDRNPCINVSELRDILREVWYAASVGVEEVHVTRWKNVTLQSTRWDLANAFFFSTAVITTIGYGHLSPSTSGGQNFCIAYAYFGIPLMAVLLSEISSKWKRHLVNLRLNLNSRLDNVLQHHKVNRVLITILLVVPAYFIVVIIPAFVFSYIEGWDFSVAHYYCFISLSTIGLGDYVATQHDYENKVLVWVYKISTSLYLIGGLGVMAIIFHGVQTNKKKHTNRSMSERFKTLLRRCRKPWLQVMDEHADMLADGHPVGSGVMSSTIAAAAVAAMVSNGTSENEGIPGWDNHLDSSSEEDNNHSDDEDLNNTSLDDWQQPRRFLRQRQKCNILENPRSDDHKSDDDLNQADEDDTPYTFQTITADSHASICINPESEKTDQRLKRGKKINDVDHPKLTRKPSLPQRLDFRNFGASKKGLIRTLSQSPTCSSLGDAKTESGGATPRMKFWSPFGSFGGEDSGIHGASSSTVEMESSL